MEEEKNITKSPSLKKMLGYVAFILSSFSIFLVFIFGIVGWITIDNIEKDFNKLTDNACAAVKSTIKGLNNLKATVNSIPLLSSLPQISEFQSDIEDVIYSISKEKEVLCGNDIELHFVNIRLVFVVLILIGLFLSLSFALNSLINIL